jgi:hypothetical protein
MIACHSPSAGKLSVHEQPWTTRKKIKMNQASIADSQSALTVEPFRTEPFPLIESGAARVTAVQAPSLGLAAPG